MTSRVVNLLLISCLTFFAGCGDPKKSPADSVNAFLRAVHRQDCKEVFSFFSSASQEKVREEAARAAKDYPTYAKDFTPENFYCTSVYANRYLTFTRGSAKNESIDGTNAVVVANVREGKNELIPGFFPLTFTNVPTRIMMVFEDGTWKLDLIKPTPEVAKVLEAREVAINKEREAIARYQAERALAEQKQLETIYSHCTNFHLVVRWKFDREPAGEKIKDETGAFTAELLGAHIVDLPEGKALQFQAVSEAVRLPEEILNNRGCGMITFRFRRDDAQTQDRILYKVLPGVFSETGIEVGGDGRVYFSVQRNSLASKSLLDPQKFYQLTFVWNRNGMRIYIDGKLDATLERPVYTSARATKTEMGRDPNDALKTGSRMTIQDLRIYEGVADESAFAQ